MENEKDIQITRLTASSVSLLRLKLTINLEIKKLREKRFVTNIKESNGKEVEREILRRYRKNRLDWVVGVIFLPKAEFLYASRIPI